MGRIVVSVVVVAGCTAPPAEAPESRDLDAAFDVAEPQMTLLWTGESDQAEAWFGLEVAGAGDVNGDGFDDIVVGAPYFDNGSVDEGRAYLYLGSASGPGTTAAWTAEPNQDLAKFGYVTARAGDVDADGYDDVLVLTRPYADNASDDEGRAALFVGSASGLELTPSWTFETDQDGALLSDAASAGDVNGDGFDDVVVGSGSYDNGSIDEGRASLYLGSASGLGSVPSWTAEPDSEDAHFGGQVAAAGDVNGDGYDDVLVSALGLQGLVTGAVHLFLGSPSGLEAVAAWTVGTNDTQDSFGERIASAGDVNGDGFADVIVAAPDSGSGGIESAFDKGTAWVYHGSALGLEAEAAWEAHGETGDAAMGESVSSAGDVNGDGFDDVVIGIPGSEVGLAGGGLSAVYAGSETGLGALPVFLAGSGQDGAKQGLRVSTAGDVNGDGLGDIVTSAIHEANPEYSEGRAYVFEGCSGACEQRPSITQARIGIDNRWFLMGAPPRDKVVWLWSTSLGATPVGGCPGLEIGLKKPTKFGSATTSIAGAHVLDLNNPPNVVGKTVHVQALFPASCLVSNITTSVLQ